MRTYEEFIWKKTKKNKSELLRKCDISVSEFEDMNNKLKEFGLELDYPVMVKENGHMDKENEYRFDVKDINADRRDVKYILYLFPFYSKTHGPGVPADDDPDSWGNYDTIFIAKCLVDDLTTGEEYEERSLYGGVYRVIKIEKNK